MKRSRVASVGMAIVGVLAAVAAFGQGPGGPGPMGGGHGFAMDGHRPPFERVFGGSGFEGRWWNNPKIVDRLKLTDDQRKAFDQILLQHRETLIDLHANLAKAELQLEPLVSADQPNESSILSQIDKVAQARAELEKANARYLLALRGKLTPDQWKQVQAFRQNRGREMWRQGERGEGHPRPGGPGGNAPNPPPPGPGPQGMLDDGGGPPAGDTAGAGVNF
jgi:periplasmic protein CpxP/Spy